MMMRKYIEIKSKENCCGCSACLNICPKNSIKMINDEEGFNYPKVDLKTCINCGLCQQVCPVIKGNSYDMTSHLYGIKHLDEPTRYSSSSGGVFSALAQIFQNRNGVIYGATFDESYMVVHQRAIGDEWKNMKTSKYVESNLMKNRIFASVKKDLLEGKDVLFVGTSCQIAGLNLYLRNVDTAKLLTCDIICHGVPSPMVWKDYVNFVKKEYNNPITDINFRDKGPSGWHETYLSIKNGDTILVSEPHSKNMYSQLYFGNYILRPICYQCAYTNLNRPGDVTLGDYWGVEKHYPELDDNKGISIVGINTKKAEEILEELRLTCDINEILIEKGLQPNLIEPSYKPTNRDWFWDYYSRKGIVYVAKRLRLLPRSLMDEMEIKKDVIVERISKNKNKK